MSRIEDKKFLFDHLPHIKICITSVSKHQIIWLLFLILKRQEYCEMQISLPCMSCWHIPDNWDSQAILSCYFCHSPKNTHPIFPVLGKIWDWPCRFHVSKCDLDTTYTGLHCRYNKYYISIEIILTIQSASIRISYLKNKEDFIRFLHLQTCTSAILNHGNGKADSLG